MATNSKISLAVVFIICLLFGSVVLGGHMVQPQKCISDTCAELIEGGLN